MNTTRKEFLIKKNTRAIRENKALIQEVLESAIELGASINTIAIEQLRRQNEILENAINFLRGKND